MNKQELINELKRISLEKQHKALTHPESKNYYEGMVMAYSQVVHMVNTVLKLDEPQKPVVPKFVAEWFEDNKHALDLAIFTKIRELDGKRYPHETDFENWLDNAENNPIENLIRMIDGYEVEKEPLYHVKLKIPGVTYYLIQTFLMPGDTHMCFSAATERYGAKWKNTFTESEIKEIDERYWAFAVPVEEVAEG